MRKGYRGIRKALAAFTAAGLLFTSSPAVFGYNVAAGQFEFAGAYSGKVNISGPREGQSGSVISGASGGGYGTATLVSGGVHRIYFDFESTYTYNAGDLLSIRYSSSLDLSADEAIIAFSDATEGHINLGSPSSVSSGYMTYTLPADTNGRFASKQPTYVRLKGNNGSAPTIVFSGVEIHSAGTLPSFAGGSVVDDTTDVFGKPTSGADWTVSNTANGGKATYTSTNGSPTYRATVPLSDYTYVAGHLISVRYENVDITGQEFIIGYDTGSNFITIGNPVSYHEGYMTFELPEDTKGIFASKQPTFVRIKGNYAGAVAGTSFRLDGVDIHKKGTRPVWDDGSIREIFPEAVATGVAVT